MKASLKLTASDIFSIVLGLAGAVMILSFFGFTASSPIQSFGVGYFDDDGNFIANEVKFTPLSMIFPQAVFVEGQKADVVWATVRYKVEKDINQPFKGAYAIYVDALGYRGLHAIDEKKWITPAFIKYKGKTVQGGTIPGTISSLFGQYAGFSEGKRFTSAKKGGEYVSLAVFPYSVQDPISGQWAKTPDGTAGVFFPLHSGLNIVHSQGGTYSNHNLEDWFETATGESLENAEVTMKVRFYFMYVLETAEGKSLTDSSDEVLALP
ncbi:MAG: hypothetical protein DRN90_06830, partial [Thermoproteota archaeon]